MHGKCIFGFLLFSFCLCGCGGAGNDSADDHRSGILEGRIHPTEKNLTVEGQVADVVDTADADPAHWEKGAEHARRIEKARKSAAFGKRSGSRERMIGGVQDVALSGNRVYLLDSKHKEVRTYRIDGTLEKRIGGPGRGPKEFQHPQAIGQLGEGHLFVVDRNRSVKVIEKTGAEFKFKDSFRLNHMPLDACALGGNVVTMGLQDEGEETVLHVYSRSGEHLRSFGQPYEADYQLARRAMSRGAIACERKSGTIIAMFRNVPILRAYSVDGKILWKSKLGAFRPIEVKEIVEDGRPGLRHRTPEGWSDQVTTVTDGPDETVLVQVRSLFRSGGRAGTVSDTTFRTYLFSGKTGSGTPVGRRVPRVRTSSNRMVVVGSNSPFPRIEILRMGNGGD